MAGPFSQPVGNYRNWVSSGRRLGERACGPTCYRSKRACIMRGHLKWVAPFQSYIGNRWIGGSICCTIFLYSVFISTRLQNILEPLKQCLVMAMVTVNSSSNLHFIGRPHTRRDSESWWRIPSSHLLSESYNIAECPTDAMTPSIGMGEIGTYLTSS